MKIYTKSGDEGSTALFGGDRVPKCDQRLNAYGTIDELNAAIGLARSYGLPPLLDTIVDAVQNRMFDLGAELASPSPESRGTTLLNEHDVDQIEEWIDELQNELPELTSFVLPGGSTIAAGLHLARCICRRAEREMIALSQLTTLRKVLLKYINRLGDLLFVLARAANHLSGAQDVVWKKR